MHKNSYVLFFALIVTVVCSLLLASAATLLKDRQQENIELDKRKNILATAGFKADEGQAFTREEVLKLYENNIKSMVLNLSGEKVDREVSDLDPKKEIDLLPLYYSEKDGDIDRYIIPISGLGLWSTIYGYLSLYADAVTVKGITFYQHGETPGLGGEIEQDWFKDSFVGKRIMSDEGELVSITVIQGKVKDKVSEEEAYHYVDGISGSTLTGKGLTNFLKKDLTRYDPYLSKIRENRME